MRQVLEHAVRLKMLDENVAKAVPNPAPRRAEVQTFESWADVDAIAEELGLIGGPMVARRMGTSVKMIDATYGHLVADAEAFERDILDAWDARTLAQARA